MKNFDFTTRKALRLAASASLALVAMVSSAHARQSPVVQVSESITLRSGNNAAGAPLSSGNDDGNITHVIVAGCTPDPFHDYNDALVGWPAKTIDSASFWVPSIGDPDARWIHSDHNPHGAAGSGFPTGSVQYAHPFVLPADMPDNAKVEFQLEFAADNFVGAVGFSDLSSIPVTSATLLSGFPTGNFSSITNVSLSGPASSFGLSAGQNSLFFRVCETDERASGLIYSVTLTIEYCKIELDLRSGFGEIPDNTPVDVVLLADTTSSMGPQIAQIQADATVILSTLTNTYPNIQIGVADYRDFPGVAFQLGQPITSNQSAINAAIMSWFPAGGGDTPEGQLYALDRLVKDPTVGWRAGSVRVIVYFGDAPGHDPICPAINPFNYLITETSVIDDLNDFGDWGTNVIAVSSGNNLNNPFTSGSSYTPTCGPSSGVAGQANRITTLTGGVVQTIGSSGQITAAILSAIDTVLSGPKPLPYGSLDPNVVHEPLSNPSAFNVLASNMGHAAVVVRPNSSWITSLPGGSAAWIHSSHSGGSSVDGTGRPPESVLYAHRFQLPYIPPNATVFLDLEWAASDSLYGVSINGDVLSAGGNVGIGGGTADEFAFPSTGNFSGPASSLSVGPGTNRLYLSQYERTPTPDTGNDECSGIMYIAKLTIAFQCDTEVTYDTFCECVSDWGPCNNPGQPGQGCANSTGVGARLTASGADHASTILHVDNLPAVIGTIGLFFGSTSQISPLVFGDGLRCVGQPMRYGVTYTYTGHTDLFIGMTNPGECYQYWYRDNSGPCGSGFNLTNAIEIH